MRIHLILLLREQTFFSSRKHTIFTAESRACACLSNSGMQWQPGTGICQKTTSVEYVEIHMIAHVRSVDFLEKNARFVSLPKSRVYVNAFSQERLVMGECNHSFHMHCIVAWVRQETSQERCPMCRQGRKQPAVWPVILDKEADLNRSLEGEVWGGETCGSCGCCGCCGCYG
jgi:hypothetical protein